jgi:hypothetical protein
MKTITTENNNGLQIKESWSKPEVTLVSINEDTLGTFAGVGSDAAIYS